MVTCLSSMQCACREICTQRRVQACKLANGGGWAKDGKGQSEGSPTSSSPSPRPSSRRLQAARGLLLHPHRLHLQQSLVRPREFGEAFWVLGHGQPGRPGQTACYCSVCLRQDHLHSCIGLRGMDVVRHDLQPDANASDDLSCSVPSKPPLPIPAGQKPPSVSTTTFLADGLLVADLALRPSSSAACFPLCFEGSVCNRCEQRC